MIEYCKLALSRYSDFQGRSRRSEFWYFYLAYILSLAAASIIDGVIGFPMLTLIVGLAGIVPMLAVIARRLHDIGRSGWYYLITFIPIVGGIILLVWFATDSEPGTNKWGINPKNGKDIDIADHLTV